MTLITTNTYTIHMRVNAPMSSMTKYLHIGKELSFKKDLR